MMMHRLVSLVVATSLLAAACSGSISASDCDELADETIELFQRVINDVDSDFGDITVDDFLATGEELPSIEQFAEDAARIDELGAELGCTRSEISSAVRGRVGELSTESDLGRFLIDAVRAGGL